MSKTISLVLLQAILYSTFFTSSYSDLALIESTCEKTAYPDPCMSSLLANPDSPYANVSGLLLMEAEEARFLAGDTWVHIEYFLKIAKEPGLKKAFKLCLDSYKILVDDLSVALDAIQKRNFESALNNASGAADEAKKCGDGFGEEYPKWQYFGRNNFVHDLSANVKSIASLLEGDVVYD